MIYDRWSKRVKFFLIGLNLGKTTDSVEQVSEHGLIQVHALVLLKQHYSSHGQRLKSQPSSESHGSKDKEDVVDGLGGGPQKRKFKKSPKYINEVPEIIVPTIADNLHEVLSPIAAEKCLLSHPEVSFGIFYIPYW
jgi:hypothetical protein